MSRGPDDPAPAGDDPPAQPAAPKARVKKRRRDGIQLDVYGIKADLRPREIGEPMPKTWREVRDAVHAKLKVIAVGVVGVVEDLVVGTRKFIRGLADIPAAAARRIDRAHVQADRKEAIKQEKLETKQLPPPDPGHVVDQIDTLLAELRAEGIAVGVEERADGSTAIMIVRPEHRQVAAQLAQTALPSPGPAAASPADLVVATVLHARVARILEGDGIRTVAELTTRSAEELLVLDGFGDKSLAAVRRALAQFKLKLRDD